MQGCTVLGTVTAGEDRQPCGRAQPPNAAEPQSWGCLRWRGPAATHWGFISSASTGGAGRTLKLLSQPKFKDSPLSPRNPLDTAMSWKAERSQKTDLFLVSRFLPVAV